MSFSCVSGLLNKCNNFHLHQNPKTENLFSMGSANYVVEVSTYDLGETLALLTSGSRYDVENWAGKIYEFN
jgi:hypothetical protein